MAFKVISRWLMLRLLIMDCRERWLICLFWFVLGFRYDSNIVLVSFINFGFASSSFVFIVEWGTGCTRLHTSSCGVKPRWYRVEDTEVTKRGLKLCHSQGSDQTSEQIPVLYSFVSLTKSSSCSSHQRCRCIKVGKWVCHGLPWRWPCLVCVSLQQPRWGPSCLWQYHGLLEFIMERG